MLRELIFILVLTLPTLQQEVIGSSDDTSTTAVGDDSGAADLPPLDPNDEPDFSSGNQGTNPQPTSPPPNSKATQDWSFIQNGGAASQTKAKWRTPSAYQLYKKGYRTTYTLKFFTDCPQNPVNFIFATTGYSFVYLNGKLIHKWGKPYP